MKAKISVLIFTVVFLLSMVQLVIAHNLATSGEEVRLLETQISLLEKENNKLSAEINQMASLAQIAGEAEKLGLTKATHVLRLTPEIPVAMNR